MSSFAHSPGVLEKNVHGSSGIIVSSKGVVNGLSDIPNDGSHFGPDTMLGATSPNQTGAPYTQTGGIQEAINYASLAGQKVAVKPGLYKLYAYLHLPSNIKFKGESKINTILQFQPTGTYPSPLGTGLVDALNQSYIEFSNVTIDCNNIANINIQFGNGGVTSTYGCNIHDIKIINSMMYGLRITGSPTVRNYHYVVKNIEGQRSASSTQGDFFVFGVSESFVSNILVKNNIVGLSCGLYEADNTAIDGITITGLGGNANGFFLASTQNCIATRITVKNTASGYSGYVVYEYQEEDNSNSTVPNENSIVNITIDVGPNGVNNQMIKLSGNNTIFALSQIDGYSATASPYNAILIAGNNYVITGNKLMNTGQGIYDTSTNTGNVICDNTFQNVSSPFSQTSPNSIYKNNPGYNPQGFKVASPAVPASGTAQKNTFQFPVRIYLLTAGAGTAYTITDPLGDAQTIPATLAAGMEFTLDAGASIALTYTTAPTWVWYGI